jgi:hypothetical protein
MPWGDDNNWAQSVRVGGLTPLFSQAPSLMFFLQIEIAIGIEIVLAVKVPFLFDFDLDCPASCLP